MTTYSPVFVVCGRSWRIAHDSQRNTWCAEWLCNTDWWRDQDEYPGYSTRKRNHGIPKDVCIAGEKFWQQQQPATEPKK